MHSFGFVLYCFARNFRTLPEQEVLYMITLHPNGVFLANGVPSETAPVSPEEGRRQTMAWNILQSHNTSATKSV